MTRAASGRHPDPPPLKPAVFHILLALAEGATHGYGAMQAVREQSGGRVSVGTASFYRHLSRLMDDGLVAEAAARPADDDPRRGTYYRLTPRGLRGTRRGTDAARARWWPQSTRSRRAPQGSRVTAPDMSLGERLYSVLLRAYPRTSRGRFAAGMAYAFCRDRERARARGIPALLAFWVATICHHALVRISGSRLERAAARCSTPVWRLQDATPVHGRLAGRVALAARHADGDRVRRGVARARHRRQHGALLDPQQPVAQAAAGARPAAARDARERRRGPIRSGKQIRAQRAELVDGAFAWSAVRFNLSRAAGRRMSSRASRRAAACSTCSACRPCSAGRSREPTTRGAAGRTAPVAVISYGFWQRRFGGAPDAIGRRSRSSACRSRSSA